VSFWYRESLQRYRANISSFNMPSYFVEQGLNDHQINSYGLYWDQFRNENSNVWFGAGVELWGAQLRKEGVQAAKSYTDVILLGSSGYYWNFHKAFYVSPELAVRLALGEKTHVIEEASFNAKWLYVFFNLHLGWYF